MVILHLKTTTMKKRILFNSVMRLLLASLFFLLANKDIAQARWQANVSIRSVTIAAVPTLKKVARGTDNINKPTQKVVQPGEDNLKCSITVHNENDDDAWGTMMIVELPIEDSFVNMPANETVDKTITATLPIAGYILFILGHMAVQQNITVEFTIT